MADTGLTHDVWLERVPQIVEECVEVWGLRLGEPYTPGAAGHAVRAVLPDGTAAVLKVIFPHREAEHEATALAEWAGDGAVLLFDYDDSRRALLMERCEPGTFLAHAEPEDALTVVVQLLSRLLKQTDAAFHSLADEVECWIDDLPRDWERTGRPFARALLDETIGLLRDLAASQGEQVLLHQDLHTDNVLAAEREPWLVIDPKPLVGEREFSVAPIVRDYVLGHSKRDVVHRLDRLTSELGLDRERALGWTIGQTVAWCFDSSHRGEHLETVEWLLEAR